MWVKVVGLLAKSPRKLSKLKECPKSLILQRKSFSVSTKQHCNRSASRNLEEMPLHQQWQNRHSRDDATPRESQKSF